MSSVFTKIRLGEMPGEVLYSDDICFVILSITPNNPGHMLLIPIEEVADWQEIKPEVFSHMMGLAQKLGKITKKIYNPPKIGLSCVGFEVSHVHIHIFSLYKIGDIDHGKARATTPEAMRVEADKIRAELQEEGLKE
jgi:histidine triad (HIT) family protein